jgi:hypothetical protein
MGVQKNFHGLYPAEARGRHQGSICVWTAVALNADAIHRVTAVD